VTRTPLSMSKGHGHQVALVLGVLAGLHGHTVIVTYPYAYMTYIVSSLASLGGGHIVAAARLQLVKEICAVIHCSWN